ncbi:MAG: ABC transporter permease [Anaerolineae bacterium]|nr:ABC transporter permease [Anaerolineae bacterium]MDW8102390.1 ABC transporter permease [Anaerolineae bacterium]
MKEVTRTVTRPKVEIILEEEERRKLREMPLWRVRLYLTWREIRNNWRLFSENKIGLIGLGIIIFFALMAIAHPILMKWVWDPTIYDPIVGYAFDEPVQPAPPSLRHPLGTDPLGRDVLSQLMYSTRSEFALGILAAIITVTIGTTVGAVAAYFGGIIDTILMRLADLIIMLPFVTILIVLSAMFKMNLIILAIVIGILSGFGGTGIVIKSQALSIKVRAYIEAARVAGGSHWHIIFRHIIPNLMPLSFLYMMFSVTSAIFSEAVLSFFGLLNIRMSWGLMIHTAQTAGYLLNPKTWWLIVPAGMSITLLCSAFYLVGRALDEVVNPRLRKR